LLQLFGNQAFIDRTDKLAFEQDGLPNGNSQEDIYDV